MNFTKEIKAIRVENAVAAGTSPIDTDIVDTAGYEGVVFAISLGAIVSGAATSAKAQQNTANSTSGMADLAGTAITIADTNDNNVVLVDVYRPRERYVRCLIDRATQNATVDGVVAFLYGAKKKPVTQDATISAELNVSPAEGTA